ncbi:hypothetical protein EXN66_Car004377 [Channa argus]|uniref:CARD domain-containing protein n=1 Tax=Channa argus TaxID=215402 RepID=A0A6G1PEL4_CHAAH|nr:hypothetical protein EXN66_Car004377 [Channa argus]
MSLMLVTEWLVSSGFHYVCYERERGFAEEEQLLPSKADESGPFLVAQVHHLKNVTEGESSSQTTAPNLCPCTVLALRPNNVSAFSVYLATKSAVNQFNTFNERGFAEEEQLLPSKADEPGPFLVAQVHHLQNVTEGESFSQTTAPNLCPCTVLALNRQNNTNYVEDVCTVLSCLHWCTLESDNLLSVGNCVDRAVKEVLVGFLNLKMFGSGTKKWFVKKPKRQQQGPGRRPCTRKKKRWTAKILKQHKQKILSELDVNAVLPRLVYDKVFSLGEYKEILGQESNKKRTEIFLDHLCSKEPAAFCSFCSVLEETVKEAFLMYDSKVSMARAVPVVRPWALTHTDRLTETDQHTQHSTIAAHTAKAITEPPQQMQYAKKEISGGQYHGELPEIHNCYAAGSGGDRLQQRTLSSTQEAFLVSMNLSADDDDDDDDVMQVGKKRRGGGVNRTRNVAKHKCVQYRSFRQKHPPNKCVVWYRAVISSAVPSFDRIHPSPTAGSITAASSASTIQGKPSLRRIKGRIHRSKSLDSIDLLDSNAVCAIEENLLTYPNSNAADGSNGPPYRPVRGRLFPCDEAMDVHEDGSGELDLNDEHREMVEGDECDSEVKLAMRDACEGCMRDPTGCNDGMTDVGCVSEGCDTGARPVYVSSDGTYGRIMFSPYLLLGSLVPELAVARTATQSQSDKTHNRRMLDSCCCCPCGRCGRRLHPCPQPPDKVEWFLPGEPVTVTAAVKAAEE